MLNLLVVMIDCLRQDRFEGKDKTALTPNLDAFLKRSTSFDKPVSRSTALMFWARSGISFSLIVLTVALTAHGYGEYRTRSRSCPRQLIQ